jgi:hypothetical protein
LGMPFAGKEAEPYQYGHSHSTANNLHSQSANPHLEQGNAADQNLWPVRTRKKRCAIASPFGKDRVLSEANKSCVTCAFGNSDYHRTGSTRKRYPIDE